MNKKKKGLFMWEFRPATSAVDGTGFFEVVGGYEVLVRHRKTGFPVIGAFLIAESKAALSRQVEAMLARFEPRWLAQSPTVREANLAIAAETARAEGWSPCART